jgi:hypothetical protein
MTRPFRFGAVAPLTTDLPTWRDRVRRLADSGYSTLLMPDVPQWQPAPGPTLALAATLSDMRVGTWVYASLLRPAWTTAWEAHTPVTDVGQGDDHDVLVDEHGASADPPALLTAYLETNLDYIAAHPENAR